MLNFILKKYTHIWATLKLISKYGLRCYINNILNVRKMSISKPCLGFVAVACERVFIIMYNNFSLKIWTKSMFVLLKAKEMCNVLFPGPHFFKWKKPFSPYQTWIFPPIKYKKWNVSHFSNLWSTPTPLPIIPSVLPHKMPLTRNITT